MHFSRARLRQHVKPDFSYNPSINLRCLQQSEARESSTFPSILYFHISARARRCILGHRPLCAGQGESDKICQNPHTLEFQFYFPLKSSFSDLPSPDLPIFLDRINSVFSKSLHFQTFLLDGIFGLVSWLIKHSQLQVCDCRAIKQNVCFPICSTPKPWEKPNAKKGLRGKELCSSGVMSFFST